MKKRMTHHLKTDVKHGIRTRFAPSPTGFLHIGSARTALFNYLFAKKNKGVFVLRIEDTDIERSKPEFGKDILESLDWLGIKWDEGPAPISSEIGELPITNSQFSKTKNKEKYIGKYGPYRQSQRRDFYKRYLEQLLKEGKAFYCFCKEEELEAKKQEQLARGIAPKYDGKCAFLTEAQVKNNFSQNKPFVIRLKVPEKKVEFNDLIRGKIGFDTSLLGDFVIAKDLENPLYNFAVVVDDYEMKISHVIRGEDHISNTPKQILIQESLDLPQLVFGHLPLILGLDRTKLSKRHGAVSVIDYQKQGYLAEALINFLAFLGWNPGTEKEIYSLPALIKDFSVEKVQKGGAIFNVKKLDSINGFYIRQKPLEKLTELCLPYLIEANLITPVFETQERIPNFIGFFGKEIVQGYFISGTKEKISFDYLQKIISLHQERMKKLSDIVDLADFFFKDKLEYKKDLLNWRGMRESEVAFSLGRLKKALLATKKDDWRAKKLEKILLAEAEKTGPEINRAGDRGHLLWPLRVALSGKQSSAGPFEIAEILGKEKTLKRLEAAEELLK